jgi:hypothetical protein
MERSSIGRCAVQNYAGRGECKKKRLSSTEKQQLLSEVALTVELETRFDDEELLPSHMVCYYQSRYPMSKALQDIEFAMLDLGDAPVCAGDQSE